MEIRAYLIVIFIGAFDGSVCQAGRIVPYKAVIEYKGNAFCAGSVIETLWILTAAKCVMNKTVSYITVRLGSQNSHDGELLISVKSTHVHPKYNSATSRRDIALLKISTSLKFSSSINSISLVKPGYGMDEGTRCTIPGSTASVPDTKAKLWTRERCQTTYPKSFNLTDDGLCAKITITNNSSNSNSLTGACTDRFMLGSPLVCEGKQVAVVSRAGIDSAAVVPGQCGDAGRGVSTSLPDFFTDVAFADQWISSHIARRKRKPAGHKRRSSIKSGRDFRLAYHRNGAQSAVVDAPFGVLLVIGICAVMG